MSLQVDHTQTTTPFDDAFFQHNLPQYYRAILEQFKKVTSSFLYIHAFFSVGLLIELCLFLPLVGKPALFAFALGFFFLTAFSYCILHFYFQAKKPEQLLQIRSQFLTSCRQLLPALPGEAGHHLSLAAALLKLSSYLDDFESKLFAAPAWLQPMTPLMQRFYRRCLKKDVFQMQQLLLHAAIEEHLKQIRSTPTDLEVHASLANTYVDLSQLYTTSEESFEAAAKLAIEEFKILSYYAPNDPWAHEQLADGYHAMSMTKEETKELELLAQLLPQNPDILHRLGSLYFAQGENAQGLKVYENLKHINYKKSEGLLELYGSTLRENKEE